MNTNRRCPTEDSSQPVGSAVRTKRQSGIGPHSGPYSEVLRLFLVCCLLFTTFGCTQRDEAPATSPHVDKVKPQPSHGVTVIAPEPFKVRFQESRFYRKPDEFLPADNPTIVGAAEATFLNDDDEVLGFVVNGQARAYPVGALCYHHVVNDRIAETPVAITY